MCWYKQNENIAYRNIGDAAKGILRGKFIIINVCIKEEERSQTNNLSQYLQELWKED